MAGSAGPVLADRARVRGGCTLGGGELLRLRRRTRAECAQRVEERPVGRLARMRESPVEGAEEDRGATVRDREGVAPEPKRQPEPEVGSEDRVRPFAGQVRRRRRNPDDGDVQRLLEARRTSLDAAQRAPRRARSTAGRRARMSRSARGGSSRAGASGSAQEQGGTRAGPATPRSARTPDRRAGSRGRRP